MKKVPLNEKRYNSCMDMFRKHPMGEELRLDVLRQLEIMNKTKNIISPSSSPSLIFQG
jgi:hypothetical protein